jgi:hypothetical protein
MRRLEGQTDITTDIAQAKMQDTVERFVHPRNIVKMRAEHVGPMNQKSTQSIPRHTWLRMK